MKPETLREVAVEGLFAGLLGYAAVVLFFVVVNLFAGQSPFYTAAALGSTLFYGISDPNAVLLEPGPILAYNGVHLVMLVVIGLVAAWLAFLTQRHHSVWYFIFFLFLGGFIFSVMLIGVVGSEIMQVIPWWSVIVSNLLWIAAMAGFLLIMHPKLVAEIKREQEAAT